jgi:SpoIID/LytB domain protein
MTTTSRLLRGATLAVVTGLLAAGAPVVLAAPAAAVPDDTVITLSGQGYGHGRGMGQYGALGYAVDRGLGWQDILRHYYGGTRVAGDAGNQVWSVQLTEWDGRETLAYSRGGTLTVPGVVSGVKALWVRRTGAQRFEIRHAPSCGGPWTTLAAPVTGPSVRIHSQSEASYDSMVGVCEPNRSRAYRGELLVVDDGATQRTVNVVRMESYLRGVVPRESPASWGNLGGGRGMNALRAQAVAARSYAYGENRSSWARTCDTVSCQVYRGAAELPHSGAAPVPLEATTTDTAVRDTAGTVMRHADGRVARTEFSSSTGGWSAGGTFPAVRDEGDATSLNPHRSWTVTMREGELASRLGVPDVRSVDVLERNGLGAQGGRILRASVDTGSTKVLFTGLELRTRLGLKSDWFTLSGLPMGPNARYVAALYLDLLGRPVDPTGLEHWTRQLDSGRMSTAAVASALVRSTESVGRIVDRTYEQQLSRPPDPAGRQYWVSRIVSGTRIADVTIGFAASPEAFQRAGGTIAGWVDACYLRLLGRPADPAGRATWITYTQQRGTTFTATNLHQSYESRLRRVDGLYRDLLGRSVDPSGRQTWAQFLLSHDDIELAASLASSLEYYQRAQRR